MCGIAWTLLSNNKKVLSSDDDSNYCNEQDIKQNNVNINHALSSALNERGPDLPPVIHSIPLMGELAGSSSEFECNMIASVLHLRGEKATGQPLIRRHRHECCDYDEEHILAWNGECYDGPCNILGEEDGNEGNSKGSNLKRRVLSVFFLE